MDARPAGARFCDSLAATTLGLTRRSLALPLVPLYILSSAVELGAGRTSSPALFAQPSERVREQGAHHLQWRLFSCPLWFPASAGRCGRAIAGSALPE